MRIVDVSIQLEDEDIKPPFYATDGAAGADVRAHLDEELVIEPGKVKLVPTGICLEIPDGYEIQVRPRSGLAFKHQVTVLNAPGTIDSDYRGELKVLLINHGDQPFIVAPDMRIAQIILAPVCQANFVQQELALSVTSRGEQGFGHTGQN